MALKLLELDVPTHKLVGEGVKLVCRFDMEGDTLYSVKWYRNEQEFYRFVPNDRPKLQIFPQHGIRVEVGLNNGFCKGYNKSIVLAELFANGVASPL